MADEEKLVAVCGLMLFSLITATKQGFRRKNAFSQFLVATVGMSLMKSEGKNRCFANQKCMKRETDNDRSKKSGNRCTMFKFHADITSTSSSDQSSYRFIRRSFDGTDILI